MMYKIIQPASHLQSFIKDYTLFHFIAAENDPAPVKPFPANTEHCLVFYLRGAVTAVESTSGKCSVFSKTAINGSQISRFDFHISRHFLMFSVHFQPGALAKFLQQPLTGFTDERIDATAILNPEIQQVHEHMCNAGSYENILQIMEDYLWKRINRLKTDFQPIDHVARMIAETPAFYTVEKNGR